MSLTITIMDNVDHTHYGGRLWTKLENLLSRIS